MTDITEMLDLVRQANPVPEPEALAAEREAHGSLLAEIDRRSDTMAGSTMLATPATRPRPKRRAVWAFVAAFAVALVVVGAVALVPRDTTDTPPADEPAATTTVAPEPTTAPTSAAPATTAPPATGAPAAPLPFETVLDEALAPVAVGVGVDGLPVIAGWVEGEPESGLGTLRLLRCHDADCAEDPVGADLVTGIPRPGSWGFTMLMGPEGYPVVNYEAGFDPDGVTVDPYGGVETLGAPQWTLLYCSDPHCGSFETEAVASSTADQAFVAGGWVFGPDGLPAYTYVAGPPGDATLHLVACADPGCREGTDTVIDAAPFLRGSRFIHGTPLTIDASGRLLTVYRASEPLGPPEVEAGWDGTQMRQEVRAAACEDATCSGGPTVTVLGEGWWPSLRVDDSGDVGIMYVTATPPHGDPPYVATHVSCLDWACTSSSRTTSGPYHGDAPLAGRADGRVFDGDGVALRVMTVEITEPGMVESEDGLVEGMVVVGQQLVFSRCADPECSSWTTTVLADLGEGHEYWYGEPQVAVRSSGLPIVVYADAEGLHLIRCLDAVCTPPD